MSNSDQSAGSPTGLTPEAAKAFHGYMVVNTLSFGAIAVIAHLLVWYWRPWFAA